jgi:hypothetical protein
MSDSSRLSRVAASRAFSTSSLSREMVASSEITVPGLIWGTSHRSIRPVT